MKKSNAGCNFAPALAVSSFLEKTVLRKRKCYMDRCFPAWFDLCSDAVYLIGKQTKKEDKF